MRLRHRLSIAVLIGAWLAAGLIGRDPWKPDEGYSVGLVYAMVQTGDYVVPRIAGEPFLEKPPLFYATAALFANALKNWLPLHDGARVATALYVSLTVLLVALIARALYGARAAAPATLFLVGSLGFLAPSHLLLTDNALVTGCAIALFGLALAPVRPRAGGILLGTGAGCAFLAKGLLGPGVLALTVLLLRLAPLGRRPAYRRSLGWAIAAAAPWLVIWPWQLFRASPALFGDWLWGNNVARYLGSENFGPALDHWMYLRILPAFSLPLLPVVALGLWRMARNQGARTLLRWRFAVPLGFSAVLLTVLSASSSSRNLYLLPILVPLSVLCGAVGELCAPLVAKAVRWIAIAAAGSFAAIAWGAWAACLVAPKHPLIAPLIQRYPGFQPSFHFWPAAAASALTLGWVAVLRMRADSLRLPLSWAAGMTLAWGLSMTLWLPYLDYGKSYRSIMAELRAHASGANCIAAEGLRESQTAMVDYFTGIPLVRASAEQAARCAYALIDHAGARPVHGVEPRWTLVWSGSRPGDADERLWLFRKSATVLAGAPAP